MAPPTPFPPSWTTTPTRRGDFGAALLFIRWSTSGERAVGHLETDYLAFGPTPDAALAPLLALTLEEVKAHLDRCVARQGAPTRERSANDDRRRPGAHGRHVPRAHAGGRDASRCCAASSSTRTTIASWRGTSSSSRRTATVRRRSRVHPRRSVLARRRAPAEHGARRAQPIAANVDQVIVVAAARDPEPNPRMLDRFLVIAEANGLPAVLVVNKIELDRTRRALCAHATRRAAIRSCATSVKAPEGLPALRDLLRGRESVLTGAVRRGEVESAQRARAGAQAPYRRHQREMAHRQAHHHARRELVPAGRSAGTWSTRRGCGRWGRGASTPDELGACFPEFRQFLDGCRFDNCRHLAEPGCAVRQAALAGQVDPDRLRVLRADLRGDQRSFLVQRSASRVVTFCIIAANASSRSMPWEFARQITTNSTSASSIARSPAGFIRLLGLLPEAVIDFPGHLAHLLREPGEVRRAE